MADCMTSVQNICHSLRDNCRKDARDNRNVKWTITEL